jgi:uncharacterized protein
MTVQLSSTARAVVTGVACAGLLIGAYTLGADRTAAAPSGGTTVLAADAAPTASGARITVTGTGMVSGAPSQLMLSMGVQTSGASVAGALRQANQAVQAITRVLTRSGVAASDIQTSGLSIQPGYGDTSSVPDGYGVSELINVTLHRLATAGTQISEAARAGGNATVINGVSLNLSDTGTLLATARARAVADAKAKASAYARALGRPLGSVISMSETSPAPSPVYPVPVVSPASSTASRVPVHPGTQQLSVTVTVVFALA